MSPPPATSGRLGAGGVAAVEAGRSARTGSGGGGGGAGRSAQAAASAAGQSMGGGGGGSGGAGGGAPRPAGGFVHRESTRVRSNVAEQVRRDLHPASLLLTLALVSAEVAAEVGVLVISQGAPCDRPLRPWLLVLIVLQLATIVLSAMRTFWAGGVGGGGLPRRGRSRAGGLTPLCELVGRQGGSRAVLGEERAWVVGR